jgi:small-conductance mechanosensitive channel
MPSLYGRRVTGDNWEAWLAASLRVLLIVVIAFSVRFLVRRAITRLVTRLGRESERRRQRSETIGSVLRSASSVAVLATAALMILSEAGVQLGPLVASAGIVGVAIGFGARNLVTDVLGGMFMLLEDQYGVGDRIDVGEATGTVLEIGMRVTTLRGDDGEVWYVRNGEVKRVGNLSQGWATATVDVHLPADADLDGARKAITVAGEELAQVAPFDELLWEPVQVLGLDSVTMDTMVVKIAAKTQPGKALVVERELRWRVKRSLDVAGIDLAPTPAAAAPVAAAKV